MIDIEHLNGLRIATKKNPLRIMMSSCLSGVKCGYDSTANGEYPSSLRILEYETASITKFCPEDYSFGTPREMCDIHGGNGLDVLNGKAKVLTESGKDWSQGMIAASLKMLEIAQANNIELAVLMDVSAACGSQVIYAGNRFAENKIYQIGAGVCAAQLIRNGVKVISQRDFGALEILYSKLDPNHVIDKSKINHHEIEWYKEYFKVV